MSASPPDVDTTRWYEDKVRRFGFDHRGLGFRTQASQARRFEALATLGDFDGRRLLDAGCGFGDFLAFLQARGVRADYTGIDLVEPMVRRCRERFGAAGRFIVGDVLEHVPDQHYDYVVASGIFGLDAEGTRERVRPTLERLFAWSRMGLAVNFLSGRAAVQAPGRVYLQPARMLEEALRLTPAVRLDHGYLPNDFTLFLYKTPAWERHGGAHEESV